MDNTTQNYTTFLSSPIQIKGRQVNNRLFLAPMAGLGNIAFRELVSEFGGFGLLFTGMCSAKAVPQENRNISNVFKWRDEELPYLVCQIFGSEPKSMALAAKRVEKEGFFGIDLNFGCCAAAICKKGCGAALLKNPLSAKDIVQAVRDAVSIPVFLKFRLGWEKSDADKFDNNIDGSAYYASDMAAMFEQAGADALVFHPRVSPDRRLRPPKWEYIKKVKDAVSIPVFGNGNIFGVADCKEMLKISNCDGISIGRMAAARPWIFASIIDNNDYTSDSSKDTINNHLHKKIINNDTHKKIINNDPQLKIEDINLYKYTAIRMVELLLKHYDETTAVKMFKKFVPYYAAGFKFGHSISKKLLKSDNIKGITKAVDEIFNNPYQVPEIIERPNLHLFL